MVTADFLGLGYQGTQAFVVLELVGSLATLGSADYPDTRGFAGYPVNRGTVVFADYRDIPDSVDSVVTRDTQVAE